MSYARWSDDSDVYLFETDLADGTEAIECCACSLTPSGWASVHATTGPRMVLHLLRHRLRGHRVPRRLYRAVLRREQQVP